MYLYQGYNVLLNGLFPIPLFVSLYLWDYHEKSIKNSISLSLYVWLKSDSSDVSMPF